MDAWKSKRKKWTVLVYANGNNELSPEIYNRFKSLQREVKGKDIYVVVQLAGMSLQRLKLLRPQSELIIGEEWTGTGRFVLEEGEKVKVEELGVVNMADPFTLYHFVTWGIARYPAENIMLILSGHGAGFVGFMTDYTQDKPYIMTVGGFTNALYLSGKRVGKAIDCVLLDACYMNMVELWYELACIPKNTVKYILAPMKNTSLEGISYPTVLKLLETNMPGRTYSTLKIVTEIFNEVYGLDNGLLLIRTNKQYFTGLRQVINKKVKQSNTDYALLFCQLNKKGFKIYNEPLLNLIVLDELLKEGQKMTKMLKNIVVEPPIERIPFEISMGPCLYFPFDLQQYEDIKEIYRRLRFSYDSKWLNMIEGKNIASQQQQIQSSYNFLPPPMVIPIKDVVSNILQQNTTLSQQEVLEIIEQLGWR